MSKSGRSSVSRSSMGGRSSMARSSIGSKDQRRMSRRPSFILVDEGEDEDISCFTVIRNMGIPILYIITGVSIVIGTICMSIITKYWAEGVTPPQCFLYSDTASSSMFYKFGSDLSACYFVAYGGIPAIIICAVCGIIYVIHVKDDKTIDFISCLNIGAVFVATLLMLIVVCTFAQGVRMTCASLSLNPANNKGYTCLEKLNNRVIQFNLPVKTSGMISGAMATLWMGTIGFMLLTTFHIALVVRRKSARPIYDDFEYDNIKNNK